MISDHTIKVILIGDSNSGKTSIAYRIHKDLFDENQSSTIGNSIFDVSKTVDSDEFKFSLWDTAGQERFRSLIPNYCRNATVALLVFDISEPETLEKVTSWYELLKNTANDMPRIILIGNKKDLGSCYNQKQINDVQKRLAIDMGGNDNKFDDYVSFIETSAKTGWGIDIIPPLIKELSQLSQKIEQKPTQLTKIEIDQPGSPNKKKGCCGN